MQDALYNSNITGAQVESMTYKQIIEQFGETKVHTAFVSRYKMAETAYKQRHGSKQELAELKAEVARLRDEQKARDRAAEAEANKVETTKKSASK
jgi:hypothetical protein